MEQEPTAPTEIVKVGIDEFEKHQREILDIERELIEDSSSAYLIDEEDELDFMLDAFKKGGYAYLAMEEGKVVGFLVVGPLNDGTELPDAVTQNYPVQNCLHIKVMYIKNTGQGLGQSMMEQLLQDLDKDQWKYLFVRTWIDPPNEGAINFYKNLAGFEIIPHAIVESTKTKQDGSGTFPIKRQYFARKA